MDIEDKVRAQMAERMSDYYSGAAILERLAAWAYVVANQQTVLEHLASFEKSYEELVGLHAIGKLGVGTADSSAENLERVKLLCRLRAPHKTSRRRPADPRRAPALLGFDMHSHAFILAPWRASVSLSGSVRFCSAL